MPRGESNSPGAIALRRAGYRKSPALWVTQEQYELIVYMAEQNLPDVDRVKRQAYGYDNQTATPGGWIEKT